ncbi:OsmC family protein [Mucilaginibacter sp. E4BP6]|uniref:OsmC family protein n=1 Tax=Mucilaginibacter sp. E4BP6 TaxID=2723089 RepID=UPI0015C79E36|nr:OsmC family protein [Mucilaginibacter sp. E4BP6]NYE65055.1 organic hydroperoxide reductase OsmC/OhrA [Mucilaginibacter sp. E4BP6]
MNHFYKATINWTGNLGKGTSQYKAYSRNHEISSEDKPTIYASSDPSFRGEATRYNPEELFVASLSSCHMLWYLHLCSEAGVIVIDYIDNATGTMTETEDGSGHFTEVTLHPVVIVTDASMIDKANELHYEAHKFCFVANSCNFPVHHNPSCQVL